MASGQLYPLLRTRPDLAITAGSAALQPDGRQIDLDIDAVAITHRLTGHRLTGTSDPALRTTLTPPSGGDWATPTCTSRP